MKELITKIKKANFAYRNGDSIMSDVEYDTLLSQLEDQMGFIEFEDFKMTLTESTGTVKLDYVLGSLTKFKFEEADALYKWITKYKIKSIFASLKIDGCSFNASWRKGLLVMCSSRGDGETGTDWTDKAKYILPVKIDYMDDLDIRGEFTLCDDSHVLLGYKNRRNGTVGIMNKDIIEPEKLKHVQPICYEVLSGSMNIYEQFEFLRNQGFMTPRFELFPRVEHIVDFHEVLKAFYLEKKVQAPYDIDGIVISSPHYTREDVFFPERKVAFKVNSEGVQAKVLGIEWNISKGGLLKPVVLIEPTEINGSTIQRVTGFNAEYIIKNGIGKGTIVSVIKSGEVIPKIISVVKNLVTRFGYIPTEFSICPSCGKNVEWKSVDLACVNPDCGTKQVKEVASFLIKSGVENVTDTSLSNWGITTYADLLAFKPVITSAVHMKFMFALNDNVFQKSQEEIFSCMVFDGAGSTNINKIIEYYGQGDLVAASKIVLGANDSFFKLNGFPEGIGQKVIDKIHADWKKNLQVLRAIMADVRYNPKVKAAATIGKLTGVTFVLTGKFPDGKAALEKLIKAEGGQIVGSVSKTLKYLVCAPDSWGSSTKYVKAEKLAKDGVVIVTEAQLRELL